MINNLQYLKFKKILLKHYKNTRVCIELKGIIDTRIFIEKSRITINKNKFIISNNDKDFTVEFLMVKKIKLNEIQHIELIYKDLTVILEL